ncbi:MAG: hypothetical protein AAF599_13585 [Bacteroidota bacterium]
MNRIRKILTQHWVVNLITTTVGVYLGIFATNYYAKKSAIEKTEKAFEKVRTELTENFEAFLEWDSTSRVNYEAMDFIVNNREDDGEFIMPTSEMDSIKKKYADFLVIEDSTLVQADTFKYEGSFSINIEHALLLSPGSNPAWTALKNSEYFNYLKFDCADKVENWYIFSQLSFDRRKIWFDQFFNLMRIVTTESKEEPDELMMKEILFDWQIENSLNSGAAITFDEFKEQFKDCIEY